MNIGVIKQQITKLTASLDEFETIYRETSAETYKDPDLNAHEQIPWQVKEIKRAWIKVDNELTRLVALFRELADSLHR